MKSPTNTTDIRNDAAGSGYYHAPRGSRRHNGVDLSCVPEQAILAPFTGRIVREAYPYASDLKWRGCVMESDDITIKMFYMKLNYNIIQQLRNGPVPVVQGEQIGLAQDITKKYPGQGMKPHIHFQVDEINPLLVGLI